jgi:hypothetical protein
MKRGTAGWLVISRFISWIVKPANGVEAIEALVMQ